MRIMQFIAGSYFDFYNAACLNTERANFVNPLSRLIHRFDYILR